MKPIVIACLFATFAGLAQATPEISLAEVTRVETALAADAMEGRQVFTPGAERASAFIEKEFAAMGLAHFAGLKDFRQDFQIEGRKANNVVGLLPGRSRPKEYVIFSAHYDHLGLNPEAGPDRVYNGANDDASGVTAVIALARYFKALGNNERSLLFVAFTGEEAGGYGSEVFSRSLRPEQVVAMFNIEMIGTESKWGRDSAFITGFDRSDFGRILQRNLSGTDFSFHPDPYPEMQLFFRSDNARLAAQGVPAHSLSTSKMDAEPNYHALSDEVSTLDLVNMTAIIKAIALSSQSIVSGRDTPSRVERERE